MNNRFFPQIKSTLGVGWLERDQESLTFSSVEQKGIQILLPKTAWQEFGEVLGKCVAGPWAADAPAPHAGKGK